VSRIADHGDSESLFEREFAGLWKPRWWSFAGLSSHLRPPVEITSYETGKHTDEIVSVSGRDDAGTRITIEVKTGARRMNRDWKRVDG